MHCPLECVLDLSKLVIYEFHFNYIKQKYPLEKSTLCFTDTDCLLYTIKTEDIYRDMVCDADRFDFSGYDDAHPCFDGLHGDIVQTLKRQNKKEIGKMKDALAEFIGLRAKCYPFLVDATQQAAFNRKGKRTKKNKGIKECVVQNGIRHSHYMGCLFNNERLLVRMNRLRSTNHHIQSVAQIKTALINYDDTRFILPDGISTRAHDHYLN